MDRSKSEYLLITILLFILSGWMGQITWANQDPFNQPLKSFEEKEELESSKKEEFELTLPLRKAETLKREEKKALNPTNDIFVKRIQLEGATTFFLKELSKLKVPYENRKLDFEELEELRQKLSLYYIKRGYVNSGVVIPDQQVIDNTVTLKVVEGKLSNIVVTGNRYFRSSYIKKRLDLSSVPPLNVNLLREKLQMLHQDHRVKKVLAELGPGSKPGEAVLKVEVKENHPYRLSVGVGNEQSPGIGSNRGRVMLGHENLTGNGDILEGHYGLSKGAEDYRVSYLMPITRHDTKLSLFYQHVESTVLEEPFEKLDIESKTKSFGFLISHPFIKKMGQEFTLSLKGELKKNETFLQDRPFSFTNSEENETKISALRFLQEWVSKNENQVFVVHSNFSFGIDAFDATVLDNGADGEFFSNVTQVAWMKQFQDTGIKTLTKIKFQWSDVSLLPMERFSVGGMNTVRGFRENRIVRDKGIIASLEASVPIMRNERQESILYFGPFYDIGWAWNIKQPAPEPENISSVGLGLKGHFFKTLRFTLYWGYALKKLNQSEYDLQDDGIHFNFSWDIL